MASETFGDLFRETVADIKARAKKLGVSLNEICDSANVARATPRRYANKIPMSIVLIDRLEAELSRRESEAAAPQSA